MNGHDSCTHKLAADYFMEWNGICYLGQRPSAGTSKVIQRGQKKERKKKKKK